MNAERLRRKASSIWREMRRRCRDAKRKDYKYYGGKGITVCEEWDSFPVFLAWYSMCVKRSGLDIDGALASTPSIDRINPSLGYCPSNCRIISMSDNSRRAIRCRDSRGRFAIDAHAVCAV